MMSDQYKIKLPNNLKPILKKSKRIFLSVNPVIAFSEVLLSLDKCIQEQGVVSDIASVDKLKEFDGGDDRMVMMACGDMPLSEIPSYLRGAIQDSGLGETEAKAVSSAPWLMLRVHISNTDNHIFNYLDSGSIEDSSISLCDESWTKFPLSRTRFDNSLEAYSENHAPDVSVIQSQQGKAAGSDFEFLE